jgi:hypothetical protein
MEVTPFEAEARQSAFVYFDDQHNDDRVFAYALHECRQLLVNVLPNPNRSRNVSKGQDELVMNQSDV